MSAATSRARQVLGLSAYVTGAIAASILVHQVLSLMLYVTVAPEWPVLTPNQHLIVLASALCACPAIVVLTRRRRDRGQNVRGVVTAGVGLILLAVSYRFTGFAVFLTLLVVSRLVAGRPILWLIWGIGVLVCLAPIDVTLRRSAAGARWVETGSCELSVSAVRLNTRNDFVCVDEGSTLYYSPSWVWVW